jgi:hypothetical protein
MNMNFEIPVETYIRLSGVTNYIRESISDEERALIRCVRLEHKDGKTLAIASNRKVAAIYHIGATTEPDGATHLNIDDKLLAQCHTEKPFNSKLFIVALPELGIVSLKTTLGYQSATAGFFAPETPLAKWKTWVADEQPTKSNGAMGWHMEDMLALNSASPSGYLNFPEWIDATKPVVLRDPEFPEFVAMFMGNRINDKGAAYTVEPATLPAWWNK